MLPRFVLRLTGGLLALCLMGAARASEPMTFEEVFTAQRRFNGVSFSPDGRYLLFSELRNDGPTQGFGSVPLPRSRTYAADLRTGRIDAVQAPGLEGVDMKWCETWSAGGRFATVMTVRDGVRLFGYWDREARRLRTFGPPPWGMCGDWLGARFLYRARLGGGPGNGSGFEDGLNHLAERWRSAWRTPQAEVTVHSNNPAFPSPSNGAAREDVGLVLADPIAGRAAIVARGDFNTVKVAPDGETFAALKLGPAVDDPIGGATGRQGELQIFRCSGGKTELLRRYPGIDVTFGALVWSPDGRSLLAAGRRPGDKVLSAFVVAVGSGEVTWLPIPDGVSLARDRENNYEAALPLGWIAGAPAFIGRSEQVLQAPSDLRSDYGDTRAAYRLYRFGERGPVSLTDFSRQSVMTFAASSAGEGLVVAEGGLWGVAPDRPPRRIGPADLRIVGFADAFPEDRRAPVLAVATVAGEDRVGVKALDSQGAPRLLVLEVGSGATVFSTATGGQRALSPKLDAVAAVTFQGWSSQLEVIGAHGRAVRSANRGWAERPVGDVRRLTYRVGDRTLDGWIVLPPDYSGGRLPALVWIYGGTVYGPAPPTDVSPQRGGTPMFNGHLWAAQGYAVIYPSTPLPRGSESDRARTLAEAATGAIDAAAAAGWVDRERAGIIGHSFGGYSVAAVLAERSDRFRAGLAMSGVYDAGAAWGARDLWQILADEDDHSFARETRVMIEESQLDLRAPPWRAAEAYRRASPFYRVASIRAPLMLMVGDLDFGLTSLQQTERFYAALVREGNPAVAIRYWGQGHAVQDVGAQRDQWSRARAWFAHYLKPQGGAGDQAEAAAR